MTPRRCPCGSRINHPTETECMNCDGPPFTVDPDRRMPVHVLDTGAFCSRCQIHRVMATGGRCPSCADDAKREASAEFSGSFPNPEAVA